MTTGKTIALPIRTFVGKVISLFFKTLSRFVIAFLPRSKCVLISWLQSLSAVILEPKKIKSVTVSISSPSICHEVMGPDAMILVFLMLSFKPVFFVYSPLSSLSRGSSVALHFMPLEWPSLTTSFIIYPCHIPYIPIYAFLLASADRGRCVPCPPKTSAITVLQISSHLLKASSIILPSFSTHIHSTNIYRAILYLDAGVRMTNELDNAPDLIKLPL